MSLFKPDYYVSSYRKIDIDRLKQAGIRLLLCDIDNTLMAYNEKVPNQEVIAFIEKVKASGITVALCSNATKKRAYRFGEICTFLKSIIYLASRCHFGSGRRLKITIVKKMKWQF